MQESTGLDSCNGYRNDNTFKSLTECKGIISNYVGSLRNNSVTAALDKGTGFSIQKIGIILIITQ